MLSLDGLAGGAATAGCCAQMVGFAVLASVKINGVVFWHRTRNLDAPDGKYRPEPENLDSTDTRLDGHRSALHDGLPSENIPAGSGMGTCGLVGPIGIYTAMQEVEIR